MKGIRVGYIRVSAVDQNTDRQLVGIELDKKFVEKASGGSMNRPQLQQMLSFLREGDSLYVHSQDRLARNLNDLRQIVQNLVQRGIVVHFVKDNLMFDGKENATSTLMLSMMGAYAEFERSILKERQREGIEIAKQKGVYKNRRKRSPACDESQRSEILKLVKLGLPKARIARDFSITRRTLYNYLEEASTASALISAGVSESCLN